MKHALAVLGIVGLLSLGGCASVPPPNFSVPNVEYSTKKVDAELKSMTVTVARPDEATGDLPVWAGTQVPPLWQTALIEALNKMAIFQDDGKEKVNLSVKILKFDVPGGGFSMTTHTEARYEIRNRKTGDIIFTQDIAASGTTPADYAFLGATRAVESMNRSVQNNISLFLQALETVDINKPMFPAKAAQ